MAWGFLAWLSTHGATSPASHCKREGGGRERGPGPQTPHAGQRQMGGKDSEKKATEPPGPSEAKESGNARAGGADKKEGPRGVNAEN